MKRLFVALMIVLGLSSASFDVLAQTCSPPPTCTATQASRWNGTGWSCIDVNPLVVGGAELVYGENTNSFGYCRLVWGKATCSGASVTCSQGTLVHTGTAHDKISVAEDASAGKFISAAGQGGSHYTG